MPEMILTSDAEVYGKPQRVGHRFHATEKEAHLWEKLGRAKLAQKADGETVEPDLLANADDRRNEPRRGRYSRRDMRAES